MVALVWASVATAVALWLAYGGVAQVTDAGSAVTSAGIVTGLIGTDLLLLMLVLAARIPVIDRVVGQDAAMALHRQLGKPALYLILAHGILLTVGYSLSDGSNVVAETIALFEGPDLALAYLALGLLVAVVVTSVVAVRRRFSYEAWHLVHLLSYLAVLVALPHQLSAGGVLAAGTAQRIYWIGLYALAFGAIGVFRFAVPAWRSLRHGIRVAGVETVATGVVSIHLVGRDLDRLQTAGGQYAIWRFWSGGTWWHAHPISFSAVPTAMAARITVRDLGRGSAAISRVRPGTRVSFEGPYGVFTDAHRVAPRLAVVAAGIGVTPIRSLLEHSPLRPGEATVLLRATEPSGSYLWHEIGALPSMRRSAVYSMLGSRPPGLSTWMSADALGRGVTITSVFPELLDSDLYVCGPSAWAELVARDARAAGLPESQLHVERFDW
ncbi:ferric reductase-like transmembrane domain-containing protein [Herbiconiux sp. CPCC 205716]|uniref:Ferric reductase-like transmembrane domain-containing protein n=1 Tax=Herbiconiux gentiana TaxID=2970912 RepID=A0ABT2GL89_9MICO|nr:ferric reductase-like transmembrane domain-containing protein [Herbiconiux gentiana]MCS5715699.1 ferric reductase-like transmembrane domain-containing protein [Herbiconiux gentiana]